MLWIYFPTFVALFSYTLEVDLIFSSGRYFRGLFLTLGVFSVELFSVDLFSEYANLRLYLFTLYDLVKTIGEESEEENATDRAGWPGCQHDKEIPQYVLCN